MADNKDYNPGEEIGYIKPRHIEREMQSSYLDYAMSVIVARALPDVRDGLKPVHRRILYAMRYPLIDAQGNFCSMDADSAAAMRYTEARMAAISQEMLSDIGKDTVDFVDNYDGTLQEPPGLPTKVPQLLLNGSVGIAVGMATNIPTHNLSEVADAIPLPIDNPDSD